MAIPTPSPNYRTGKICYLEIPEPLHSKIYTLVVSKPYVPLQESRFQPNFEKCGRILTAFCVKLRANERSIEMRTEQGLLGFQRDLERGAKLLDKGDVAFRELRERPGLDFSLLPARLFTRRGVLARDQPGIRVAHHDRAVQVAQPRQCLGWLRSPLQRIAQTHHLLNALSLHILKHPIKRETFTVNIGNNRKTHGSIPFLNFFVLMA
jgi:hypothetical protein